MSQEDQPNQPSDSQATEAENAPPAESDSPFTEPEVEKANYDEGDRDVF